MLRTTDASSKSMKEPNSSRFWIIPTPNQQECLLNYKVRTSSHTCRGRSSKQPRQKPHHWSHALKVTFLTVSATPRSETHRNHDPNNRKGKGAAAKEDTKAARGNGLTLHPAAKGKNRGHFHSAGERRIISRFSPKLKST